MDRRQLVDTLSTTLLWEVVCVNIEKINQLPIMLKDIGYVEDIDNVIAQITECEVFNSEPIEIINFDKHEDSILITFEMQFVLSAWSGRKQLLRITAAATGKCRIPDIGKYDWESINFEDMGKKELLTYEGLVDILELNYPSAECDDVSMFAKQYFDKLRWCSDSVPLTAIKLISASLLYNRNNTSSKTATTYFHVRL